MALGDLTARLRQKFIRRNSTASSFDSQQQQQSPSLSSIPQHHNNPESIRGTTSRSIKSRHSQRAPSIAASFRSHKKQQEALDRDRESGREGRLSSAVKRVSEDGKEDELHVLKEEPSTELLAKAGHNRQSEDARDNEGKAVSGESLKNNQLLNVQPFAVADARGYSSSTADFSTPNTDITPIYKEDIELDSVAVGKAGIPDDPDTKPAVDPSAEDQTLPAAKSQRPHEPERKQSLLPYQQTSLIKTLLQSDLPPEIRAGAADYFVNSGPLTISPNMISRKIWVKRPGASATLVTIHEDDLVDDVREMILKKYANSLGRNFDAPDVTLRIIPREQRQERILGPEEPMGRTLDAYFPGGQMVEEALIIDVPVRKTPRPSPLPHALQRYYDDVRPAEAGTDYFPQMPIAVMPSPQLPHAVPVASHHPSLTAHSMSVLTTGQIPPLPSPGSVRRHHNEPRRPNMRRQHTSSPTVITSHSGPVLNNGTLPHPMRRSRSRTHSSASEKSTVPPIAPPLPTPPAPTNDLVPIPRTQTPPPRISSPRPAARKKGKPSKAERPSLPTGMLNAAVPPINVLIVEDNIINLKLLEAFMKKLKVRWQTAMNGKEAVNKWRTGGFHLVLMDIQLPIMNGLEATKEIRRLERVNNIGVFSSSAASSTAPEKINSEVGEATGDDKLAQTALFKSPVIIVALTASSLQSDRHEALAAGCNDFLTKVSLVILLVLRKRALLTIE